ncbi:deaminase, partial [Janibacter sp. RAF20_2_2]
TVEWAQMWRAVPKVVFSRTLTQVTGTNTRLATRGLADEIAALRAQPGEGGARHPSSSASAAR